MARDTKLGPEEITRDIPNVSEEALKKSGRSRHRSISVRKCSRRAIILVGKITPKGESPMTPEEKLLRAISRKRHRMCATPPCTQPRPPSAPSSKCASSTATGWKRRARHGDRARRNRAPGQGPRRRTGDPGPQRLCRLIDMLRGPRGRRRPEGLQEGHGMTCRAGCVRNPPPPVVDVCRRGRKAQARSKRCVVQYDESKSLLEHRFMDKVEKVQRGDKMPPGRMKMVKVFVAVKRKIQPGDKMPAVTATRASSPASCRSRTCRSSKTGRMWTSFSTRSACLAHECRPDPRDPPWLGLRGHGPPDRRYAGCLQGRRQHRAAARHHRQRHRVRSEGEPIKQYDDESIVRLAEHPPRRLHRHARLRRRGREGRQRDACAGRPEGHRSVHAL